MIDLGNHYVTKEGQVHNASTGRVLTTVKLTTGEEAFAFIINGQRRQVKIEEMVWRLYHRDIIMEQGIAPDDLDDPFHIDNGVPVKGAGKSHRGLSRSTAVYAVNNMTRNRMRYESVTAVAEKLRVSKSTISRALQEGSVCKGYQIVKA